MYDLWKENIRMKGAKEFLDCYEVVSELQGVTEDVRKAMNTVKEAGSELKKED